MSVNVATSREQLPLPVPGERGDAAGQNPLQFLAPLFGILFGIALTLAINGYQFGQSNHTVYLLDALRRSAPDLLARDWFTTKTFQYHALFSLLTRTLDRLHMLRPGFLDGYLLLLALLHLAWWRLVRLIGGSVVTFAISEVLFHVSFGGAALGMYQLLQDGAFLPSNIANVAMLWALYFLIAGRETPSAFCFATAAVFHLNHAVVSLFVWFLTPLPTKKRPGGSLIARWMLPETLIVLLPACANIAWALQEISGRTPLLPLKEFVQLYVRLRHPHHYDPSTWPIALWLSFLWPLAFLPVLLRRRMLRRNIGLHIYILLWSMVLIALVFAGVFYISEPLIQLSLYRFSVFIQLANCIAIAYLFYDRHLVPSWLLKYLAALFCISIVANLAIHNVLLWPYRAPLLVVTATIVLALIVTQTPSPSRYAIGVILLSALLADAARNHWLGFHVVPEDSPSYLAACDWIRDNTPKDAIFLVPPSEQTFRLRAQRAIVVNFKAVPQLNSELIEWRNRLQTVLDLPDLTTLPIGFRRTLDAIRQRYESLPPEHLVAAARAYDARYILVGHRLPGEYDAALTSLGGNRSWFLYDLNGFSMRSFADAFRKEAGREGDGGSAGTAEGIWDPG